MTKKLFSLANRMRQAFRRKKEHNLRQEDLRLVRIQEQIIYLNTEEAAFIALETRRLLRAQRQESKRKKKQGLSPTPGKIAYAVYM